MEDKIVINGKTYVAWPTPMSGPRVVLVVDRGWIWAGNLTETKERITLTSAIQVVSWTGCHFDGMIANPKSKDVRLRPIANTVHVPRDSEIFRVQVPDDWGV